MATFNNTIINRLGYTCAWEMSWAENSFRMYKNYIQKDFLLFRLIKIYFVHYSTSFFTHKFHRNIKEGKKKSAKKHIINNYFVDFGINFSHLEITRNPYLGLNCYFMDTLMEDWKLRYNYKAKKLPSFYIRTREHTRVSLYKNKDKVQRKQYPIYEKLRKRRFLAKIHLLKKAKPYAFRHKCNINRVLTINKRKCNVSKHLYPFKIYKNIKEKLKIIKRKALAKKRNTKFYRFVNEMFKKRNSHIKPIKQKVNVKQIKRYKPKIKKHKKLHFLYKKDAILENIKISKRCIYKGKFQKGINGFCFNSRKYRKEEAAAADLIKRYKKLKMAKNKKYKAYCKKRKVKLLVIDTHTTVSGNYVISYSKNTKVLAIPSIPLTVKKHNLYNTNIFMHSLYVRQSLLNITKRYMQNNKTIAKEIGKDVVKSITPQQTTPISTSPQKTRLSTEDINKIQESKSANSSPPKRYTEPSARPKSAPPRTHFDPKQIKPELKETAQKQMNPPVVSTTNNVPKKPVVNISRTFDAPVQPVLLKKYAFSTRSDFRLFQPITNETSTTTLTVNQETLSNTIIAENSSQELITYTKNEATLKDAQQISNNNELKNIWIKKVDLEKPIMLEITNIIEKKAFLKNIFLYYYISKKEKDPVIKATYLMYSLYFYNNVTLTQNAFVHINMLNSLRKTHSGFKQICNIESKYILEKLLMFKQPLNHPILTSKIPGGIISTLTINSVISKHDFNDLHEKIVYSLLLSNHIYDFILRNDAKSELPKDIKGVLKKWQNSPDFIQQVNESNFADYPEILDKIKELKLLQLQPCFLTDQKTGKSLLSLIKTYKNPFIFGNLTYTLEDLQLVAKEQQMYLNNLVNEHLHFNDLEESEKVQNLLNLIINTKDFNYAKNLNNELFFNHALFFEKRTMGWAYVCPRLDITYFINMQKSIFDNQKLDFALDTMLNDFDGNLTLKKIEQYLHELFDFI